MKKNLHTIILFLIISSFVSGQGIVRGKITNENGEPMPGAGIILKSQTNIGCQSDFDGNYSLKITQSTPQVLQVSFISYQTIEFTVNPQKGQVIVKNFSMTPSAFVTNEVNIVAKSNRASEQYMENIKMKSAVCMDYISSETIKQTGDSHINDAVKRITGVSTVGGYISVRGLADRYLKTTINGAQIPTLDPFTNNIKLDMFPSNLVDNIIITKTGSPDYSGDWSGAFLSVETKDYPEKFSLNITSSIGYNDQSTFKNILSSRHSSTEWLGYDDGFRDFQHYSRSNFPSYKDNPIPYDEFCALGLSEYIHSLGLNESHLSYNSESFDNSNNIYYRLCLVELGILAPGLLYDETAFDNSKKIFTDQYAFTAFKTINAGAEEFGTSIPNNWALITRKAPLDFSQEITIGNQITLFNRPFGFLFGLRYGSSVKYDPHSIKNDGNGKGSAFALESSSDQESTEETNAWSALMNIAYKINSKNSISLLFMPNLIGQNKVIRAIGGDEESLYANGWDYGVKDIQKYQETKRLIYQLQTEHYIPWKKIKIEFRSSYTDGQNNTPDFKSLSYGYSNLFNCFQWPPSNHPQRRYMYLDEDIFDSRLTVEIPLDDKPGMIRKIKFGASYTDIERDYYQYVYVVEGLKNEFTNYQQLNQLFDTSNFKIQNNGNNVYTMPMYYVISNPPVDENFGKSKVTSGFAMIDYNLNFIIRFSAGLRVEYTDIFSDITSFIGLPRDHPYRIGAGLPGKLVANPGVIQEMNYLPSLNAVYLLKDDQNSTMNLRFNYSYSIARPSLREITAFPMVDINLGQVIGNPDLKMVKIHNFDIRYESYFKSGDNIFFSLFYKRFKNAIELVNVSWLTWLNADTSFAYGAELEGKKNLFRNFNVIGNVTYIYSQTRFKHYMDNTSLKRTMYGQSPYIINAILSYNSEKYGISAALSYNIQGPKIFIATKSDEVPDIFELPMHMLDFKVSKSIGKHITVSAKVRNLLNQPYIRAYDFNNWSLIYDKYTWGTNYGLSVSYKI